MMKVTEELKKQVEENEVIVLSENVKEDDSVEVVVDDGEDSENYEYGEEEIEYEEGVGGEGARGDDLDDDDDDDNNDDYVDEDDDDDDDDYEDDDDDDDYDDEDEDDEEEEEEEQLEIERRVAEGVKKLFDDVEVQLDKEKQDALTEARRKEPEFYTPKLMQLK